MSKDPNSPIAELLELVKYSGSLEYEVKYNLAQNPSSSAELLLILHRNEPNLYHGALMANPNTPTAIKNEVKKLIMGKETIN